MDTDTIRRIIREELRSATNEGKLVTPVEASLATGYAPSTLLSWVRKGKLTRHGTPRKVLLDMAELRRLLAVRPSTEPTDAEIEAMADKALGRAG